MEDFYPGITQKGKELYVLLFNKGICVGLSIILRLEIWHTIEPCNHNVVKKELFWSLAVSFSPGLPEKIWRVVCAW